MRPMDDAMIATHLRNLDRRLARLDQILPSLATKEDLPSLATKEDLRSLATKEDLRSLATKGDLRSLATKEDLRLLATKEELRLLASKEELRSLATKEELRLGLAEQSAELRREIRDEGEQSRRYMDLLIEGQRGDIQLLAEHLSVVMSKMTDK
jgi:hypothetical protein